MSIRKEGHIDPKRDFEAIARAIDRELRDVGEDLVADAKKYLVRNNVNTTRQLSKSVTYTIEKQVENWRLNFGANTQYALFVHDGTKPHWIGKDTPAGKSIRRWVFKKLGKKGKDLDRTAFFVRRKIAREGTKARPFLIAALDVHLPKVQARIRQAIEEEVNRAN